MDFEVSNELNCHRCDGPILLSARVPHTLTRTSGERTDGTRGIGLCPTCDSKDPDAQGVLAFFALHGSVADHTVASIATLIDEWVHRIVRRPQPAEREMYEAVEHEYRRWREGDL